MKKFTLLILFFSITCTYGQDFLLGVDLSYVNEMEDCGAEYYKDGAVKDVYEIFSDHGANIVRLRLWHTPTWYTELNNGNIYSDFVDVCKSIERAKSAGMKVLLDFHLSDNWADPSKQLVPKAWLNIVNDVDLLKDSLFDYLYNTLEHLAQKDLMPEYVQIGNETNKGILLSPSDNEVFTLEWPRNAILFNAAIDAVRKISDEHNRDIDIVLHLADPSNASWLMEAFTTNGVLDFDIIGLSYYWQWHQPTTIQEAGDVVANLRQTYPDKEVALVEVGIHWTQEENDQANNILNEVPSGYNPISPSNQKKWLIDLTNEVQLNGGIGVFYWEPAWVSTPCFTQWGRGSHYENASFFNFENELIEEGGIAWLNYDYDFISSSLESLKEEWKVYYTHQDSILYIQNKEIKEGNYALRLFDMKGNTILIEKFYSNEYSIGLNVSSGNYFIIIMNSDHIVYSKKMIIINE
ncbi:MAG: glycosyl hydrolase 53 family protein [Bacteroidota bacterium]